MNISPYQISGLERRKLKQELNRLKSLSKIWWYCHTIEKDMASFYGGDVMSDELSQLKYDSIQKEIDDIEQIL